MRIGIDFDGTIATDNFPDVGEPVPHAFDVMKQWESDGHQLVLWTVRSGPALEKAIQFIWDNDVKLYAVNRVPGQLKYSSSPKAHCHIFVDDKAVGCPLVYPKRGAPYVDWPEVEKAVIDEVKRRTLPWP